ncbi:MAG: DUF4810 domain-containing protein [Bacteroidota bacterium]|nr:DUF4810 domain-containing protein [Bacteroidota bacterium]
MNKFCAFLVFVVVFTSCTSEKPLYTWGNYEKTSYNYLKKSDETSTQELIETYQEILETQKGTRKTVPPGICADYGYLLLQEGKTKEGKKMLMKEIALYPESKVFIDRILKMIEE